MTKPKILVVEDKPENIATAKALYSTKTEYDFDYAGDYDGTIGLIEKVNPNGIITDCFMPKQTGSGNIDLGISLIDRLMPYAQYLKDPRDLMLRAMQESEANQPLGILIIEYAIKNKIPCYMLTTRHDMFGERIILPWCEHLGAALGLQFGLPREAEKCDPSFNYKNSWGVALDSIEQALKK